MGSRSVPKRAGLYLRVSTLDQHPETQRYDLVQLAEQRGFQIVDEYVDKISGTRARRPALDRMLSDAHRRRFDVLVVWAFDRLARSVRHFLQLLDELDHLGVEFVSFRENVDSSGPLGRAMVTILGAVAELERNLIIERVRSGMRRAKLEGQHIGRSKFVVNREAVLRDRQRGYSIRQIAKLHRVSKTSVCRVLEQSANRWNAMNDPNLAQSWSEN